jgi:hypothetical protein
MSINQELAVGVDALPGHAATSSMRLEAVAEVASAGLGEVTEAPPTRGDDVAELASVAKVASADSGDIEAALVGGGDVAEAALVGGDVTKSFNGGDDIKSPSENGKENEAEVTLYS